ncbi:MAG: NPCBM/NEW2 domain-containing protein [Pirellulales bacterium]|nr:NPCBM/NEW2 domain-containing protein [Pirellulales bacterium]
MWSVLLVFALVASAPEVEVGTLDGSSVTGIVSELSRDGIKVATADGDQSISVKRLLFVSPAPAPIAAEEKPSVWIDLVDGSRLTANRFLASKGAATLSIEADDPIEIPAAVIARVRFSAPDDPATAWPADIGKHSAADLLAVRKMEAVDFLEGVVGDVTEETIQFLIDGETIPVKRGKVDGLIYYHKAGDKPADALCVVEDSYGWRLNARSITLGDDGSLDVATLAGPVLRRPWGALVRLDFSGGKVVYLSDLTPESVERHSLVDFGDAAPALAAFYQPRRDRGREGGPIRVAGKTYPKGMALSSRTATTYRLPSGASKFKALAGIDDAVREAGHVVLTISADGKQLFSAPVAGLGDPVPLDLDVAGARKLTILVDYGDDIDTGDYLNLADARIVK